MALDRRRIALLLSLSLPLLAVGGMILRAERVLTGGTAWAVRIGGYDPRDLLRGQYLRYRIGWRMEGEQCHGSSCCYCLWNADPQQPAPPEPAVRVIDCADRAPCESWFRADQIEDLEKYFIPEGEGPRLEAELRKREAALLLKVTPRGCVGIEELLLDRRPWRELR